MVWDLEASSYSRDLTDKFAEQALEEPQLLFRETIRCPSCGSVSLALETYLYKVPHFGNIIIDRGICASCGFKYRDVRVAETDKPKKIIVRVEGEQELRYLVVKPSSASILIPEKGYESIPGPYSPGYITTVEGILSSFLEAVKIACRDSDQAQCKEHAEWLSRAIEGLESFTLVMCDYEGTGKILGEKVVIKNLDRECKLRNKLK